MVGTDNENNTSTSTPLSSISVSDVKTILDLIAPKQKIIETLSYRWKTIHEHDETSFVNDPLVQQIGTLMKFIFLDLEPIAIHQKKKEYSKYVFFCETMDCQCVYVRRAKKLNKGLFCDECRRLRAKLNERKRRREKMAAAKENEGGDGGDNQTPPVKIRSLWNGKPTKRSYYDDTFTPQQKKPKKDNSPMPPYNGWIPPYFSGGYHPMMMMGGATGMPPPMNGQSFPFMNGYPPSMAYGHHNNNMMMNHPNFYNPNEYNPNQEKYENQKNQSTEISDETKTQDRPVQIVADPSQPTNESSNTNNNNTASNTQPSNCTNDQITTDDTNKRNKSNDLAVENEDNVGRDTQSGTFENHTNVSGTNDVEETNLNQTTICDQSENATNTDTNKTGNVAMDTVGNELSNNQKTQSTSSSSSNNNIQNNSEIGYHPMMMMNGGNPGMPPPQNWMMPHHPTEYPPQMPIGYYNNMMMNNNFHNTSERNPNLQSPTNQVHLADSSQNEDNVDSNRQTGMNTNESANNTHKTASVNDQTKDAIDKGGRG